MAEEDTVVNKAERLEGPGIKGEEDPLLGPTALPFGPTPVAWVTRSTLTGARLHWHQVLISPTFICQGD